MIPTEVDPSLVYILHSTYNIQFCIHYTGPICNLTATKGKSSQWRMNLASTRRFSFCTGLSPRERALSQDRYLAASLTEVNC